VVCFSYAVRHIHCYMSVLTVLCYRLNRYHMYLASEVILACK
jgi:hypothetical protein